jgi:alpha-1,3-glucosyltransferase
MNLYLAPAFFCYLLGKAFRQDSLYVIIPSASSGLLLCTNFLLTITFSTKVVGKVAVLGFWVIVTFAVCWLPFLTRLEDASTVFHRLFPVGRGLYEDKVANFWCSVSPFLKMKVWFDNTVLFKIWYAQSSGLASIAVRHL